MMFFSRVRIDPSAATNRHVLRVLQGNAYGAHVLIWKLFPNQPDAKRDFLFRQEFEKEQISYEETQRGWPIFYTLSMRKPEPVEGLLLVECKSFAPRLSVGLRLSFDVRVNPVVQEKVPRQNLEQWREARRQRGLKDKDPTKLRKYHDVLMNAKVSASTEIKRKPELLRKCMDEAAIQWLVNMSDTAGFSLETVDGIVGAYASGYGQHVFSKNAGNRVRFSTVDLSGLLTITDPETFLVQNFTRRDTQGRYIAGLGHAKSFGCGLMLVRPA